jgi:hypothetical protein
MPFYIGLDGTWEYTLGRPFQARYACGMERNWMEHSWCLLRLAFPLDKEGTVHSEGLIVHVWDHDGSEHACRWLAS